MTEAKPYKAYTSPALTYHQIHIKKGDKDSKGTVYNKWFKRDQETDAVEFR